MALGCAVSIPARRESAREDKGLEPRPIAPRPGTVLALREVPTHGARRDR